MSKGYKRKAVIEDISNNHNYEKVKDIVTKCFLENNDTFKKLFNDSDFYAKVMEAMAKELYKELREEKK